MAGPGRVAVSMELSGRLLSGRLMNSGLTPDPTSASKSPVWFIAASFLFVSAIVAALWYSGGHEQLVHLLEWVESQGLAASAWFILIMIAVVVFLLPGIFFTTGAGFVFGVVEGSIYVVVGTTLGAAVSFLVARHLFGRRAARFVASRGRLDAVNEEMARYGWKVVMLTRLIPFFPAKLANYFFGLTTFSFRGYVFGSLIGFIPFSVHNVYLGAVAADIATLGEREAGRSPVEWALYGAGFLVTVAAVIYINRLARRALARYGRETGIDKELS